MTSDSQAVMDTRRRLKSLSAEDYDRFNEIRTIFMERIGLDPLPASTGIQARICRTDLLVEIEAMAVIPRS